MLSSLESEHVVIVHDKHLMSKYFTFLLKLCLTWVGGKALK